MIARRRNGSTFALTLLLIVALLLPFTLQAATFTAPEFRTVWQRTDQLVAEQRVTRTWIWGPEPLLASEEPYSEGRNGVRSVLYFDKSRMEINNPDAPRDQWYVTNGLLVSEMVRGQIQVGAMSFTPRPAPTIPVAGDLSNNPNMPTYADFGKCEPALVDGLRQTRLIGEPVTAIWTLRECPNGVDEAKGRRYPETAIAYYDEVTGANIPGVFWRYFAQSGDVLQNGRRVRATPLFDWLYVLGHPITAAYWTKSVIGGQERDVLVQLFERRVLTYTPDNPVGWQVEMGNVGQHYMNWRYDR